MSDTNALDARIASVRSELRDGESHCSDLVQAMATATTAKDQNEIADSLRKARKALAVLKDEMSDLERAREIAHKHQDDAAKLEKLELAKREATSAFEHHTKLETEIAGLLAYIDGIPPRLARIEALQNDAADAAYNVLKTCTPDPAKAWSTSLVDALRGQGHRAAVIDALHASGIGKVAFWLQPFVEVLPARGQMSADEINSRAKNIIHRTLSKALKEHEAKLQGEATAEVQS